MPGMVIDTTSGTPASVKATWRASRAASVAYPCPHADRANRQPTSSAGVKCASNGIHCRPVKPMNSPVSRRSTAHSPYPYRSKSASILATMPSLATRSRVPGKWRITSGSALSAANGTRSLSRHRRSSRRSVRRCTDLSY